MIQQLRAGSAARLNCFHRLHFNNDGELSQSKYITDREIATRNRLQLLMCARVYDGLEIYEKVVYREHNALSTGRNGTKCGGTTS